MTIQRQYSLPNCTLILEGLSDSSSFGGQPEVRPLMSILVNVECRLVGQEEPLRGGREFFESLIAAVSRYAQEFFSQVHVPVLDKHGHKQKPVPVQLERISQNLHRLIVQPQGLSDSQELKSAQVELTTVQLFDLVEAVDQFFADTQTLPSLSLQVGPASKRYALNKEPVAQRAVPVALGASGLAFAAIAFFFVPIPEVKRPETTPNPANSGPVQEPTTQPSPTAPPSPDQSKALPLGETKPSPMAVVNPGSKDPGSALTAPEITDPALLSTLGKGLYTRIDEAWKTTPTFTDPLVYRVGVGNDGAIVGYRPVNQPALDYARQTPLLDLLTIPTGTSTASLEPIAQFKVVFTPAGVLEVSPWHGYDTAIKPDLIITSATQLEELSQRLYQQLNGKWESHSTFEQDLVYRVKVDQDGVIAGYEAENQPAVDFVQDTPLPGLLKSVADPTATVAPKPLAQLKVVFSPSGTFQVSPW